MNTPCDVPETWRRNVVIRAPMSCHSAFMLSFSPHSKRIITWIKMATSWILTLTVQFTEHQWQRVEGFRAGGISNDAQTRRVLSVGGCTMLLSYALKPGSHPILSGMKTEEQRFFFFFNGKESRPRSSSHPPKQHSDKPGDDGRWRELPGNGEAHSPSGSPHSVHCDSKQGPKRDNRRLIEATHVRRSVFVHERAGANISVAALCMGNVNNCY